MLVARAISGSSVDAVYCNQMRGQTGGRVCISRLARLGTDINIIEIESTSVFQSGTVDIRGR